MTDNHLEVLTPDQLARMLHCSTRHLERLRVRGDGPRYTRIGKLVRYRRCDVEAYLQGRRAGSTSEADQRDRASAAA